MAAGTKGFAPDALGPNLRVPATQRLQPADSALSSPLPTKGNYFEMIDLIIGSVVRLRSGGPDMTIQSMSGQDCTCLWFSGSELNTGEFALGSLRQADVEGERVRVIEDSADRPRSTV